ncbi:MAG: hypothetical protein ACKOUS_20465, partial [Alphaproteobacteria bacterium]
MLGQDEGEGGDRALHLLELRQRIGAQDERAVSLDRSGEPGDEAGQRLHGRRGRVQRAAGALGARQHGALEG